VDVAEPGMISIVHVKPGDTVKAGDPIIELKNLDLDLQIAKLETQRGQTDARLNVARLGERQNSDLGYQIGPLQELIRSLDKQLLQLEQKKKKLLISASTDGVIVPPKYLQKQKSEERLGNWFGYPIDKSNVGAFLPIKTEICQIVRSYQKDKHRAVLLVDQEVMEFIAQGQRVELQLKAVPGVRIESQLMEISPIELKKAPANVSAQYGGPLVTQKNDQGEDVPQSATFPIRAPFESDDPRIQIGMTGFAKINAGSKTIGQRAWRFFCRTFNFDL